MSPEQEAAEIQKFIDDSADAYVADSDRHIRSFDRKLKDIMADYDEDLSVTRMDSLIRDIDRAFDELQKEYSDYTDEAMLAIIAATMSLSLGNYSNDEVDVKSVRPSLIATRLKRVPISLSEKKRNDARVP